MGATDYSCDAPDGTLCISTYNIYSETHGGNDPYIQQNEKEIVNENQDDIIKEYISANIPNKSIPIRTPSKVMRIWIAPWEDTKSGAFIASGYLYTEIEKRTWVLSNHQNDNIHKLFTPLNTERRNTDDQSSQHN
ncbi:MAG: TraV family lipoprotein [Candidatus Thiodiazotropha endolucinida]|nr:TraV family lipoprotein [Candidatus Thiodiazotropha taylori]MCW4263209.1 TraV family lipoprotein [Candidatus Thiodiazotropha endolucinida]